MTSLVAWQVRPDRQLSSYALRAGRHRIDRVARLRIGNDTFTTAVLVGSRGWASVYRAVWQKRGCFGISLVAPLQIGGALLAAIASINVGKERLPWVRSAGASDRSPPEHVEVVKSLRLIRQSEKNRFAKPHR